MFMLRNVSKYLFGDTTKESLIDIPQGLLYIVRPQSPKGYSELIFKDAAATIRRTGQDHHYQLVIQRAYEEGEEELADDQSDPADPAHPAADADEKSFLLDQSLRLRSEARSAGGREKVLAWRDLSGDPGDLYEFVCDASVAPEKVATFLDAAAQCQFERKYRRSAARATREELREFYFEEEAVPPAVSPAAVSPAASPKVRAMPLLAETEAREAGDDALLGAPAVQPTQAPPAAAQPDLGETLTRERAELHLFDFTSGAFILQDSAVVATVAEVGEWEYWLQVSGEGHEWLGLSVTEEINPVFNFEYLSFIFNHQTESGDAYSWLLRFKDQAAEERFQEGLMQALWEKLNRIKWAKAKEQERDYVLEAFNDLTLTDAPEGLETPDDRREREAKEEDEEAEARAAEEAESDDDDDAAQQSEHYDSDEDEDDVHLRDKDGNVNSQLAVGYKHDRSFVVRGSKIGVFKHTPNNNLEFSTTISKIETPGGKLFSPKKVMLHAEDSNMILQNSDDPNSLYRMDLEYGKIVDEWKVHDDIPVQNFTPETKFAQMTAAQPFLGISQNALYRIDPRLAGAKLVDADLKQYASKNAFSALATTEQGYIAVASDKGDIRLFDRLGVNAKTHIPALGEPITGLDVSADGRYLLATCRTYLLLVDALQPDSAGRYAGRLGFERSFPRDAKPQPRRLGLAPAHVAQFRHETRAPLAFTPARFDAGVGRAETSIITATGPFVVTWSLKKVLAGRRDAYTIKRYAEEVKADAFRYGSDKSAIVALPNEVNMVAKRQLRKVTRESIAGPEALRTPRKRGGRIGSLLREEVVNSPY